MALAAALAAAGVAVLEARAKGNSEAVRGADAARAAKPVVAEKADAAEDNGRAPLSRARVAPEPAGQANGNKVLRLAVNDAGADKAAEGRAAADKVAADNSPTKTGKTPARECSSF